MMHLLSENERKAAYQKLVYESGRAAFQIGFWLLDFKGAAGVDESQIARPMLIIAGGQDRITPASVTKKLHEKYKAVSKFVEYPDHAHWVLGEPGWEKIAQDVAAWLKQNGM